MFSAMRSCTSAQLGISLSSVQHGVYTCTDGALATDAIFRSAPRSTSYRIGAMAYNGAMDRCDVGGQMVLDTCQGCDIATVHDSLFAKVLTLYSILITVHIPSHATVDIHTLFRFIVIVCHALLA